MTRSGSSAAACFTLLALALVFTGCASTAVDMTEPRRVVGTESSVRVDAQIVGEQVTPGARLPITWEITNQRSTAIAIADLIPETSYDAEANTFTVTIGSEVPGNQLLPRLIEIRPGQKQSFSGTATLRVIAPPRGTDPLRPPPASEIRLKVNFLGETEPFRQLIGLKENGIADPTLADALFPLWLERNEVVYTNSVPMRWVARQNTFTGPAPRRRRGGTP